MITVSLCTSVYSRFFLTWANFDHADLFYDCIINGCYVSLIASFLGVGLHIFCDSSASARASEKVRKPRLNGRNIPFEVPAQERERVLKPSAGARLKRTRLSNAPV